MRSVLLSVALLILCIGTAGATDDWKPLQESVDKGLQASLEARLNANPQWRKLIHDKKMAVSVVDLRGPGPRFARINGDHMMYAASLPKIAILLAAHASIEDGSLKETPAVQRDLVDMIRVSSNAAATRLIDQVGMKKIEAVLRDPRYGFYDEAHGGGLWVGKRYASAGPRVGDPLHNISHGATATQVARFFYLLSKGRLINPERSSIMLEELADPALHHKFVSQVENRAPGARMFRKSGTWKLWHSDAIMVRGTHWRDYILVGLVESRDGESILRQVLPAVEDLLVPPEVAALPVGGE